MHFKTESAFTRWFCKQLEGRGAETVTFVGSRMQRAGIPDRYVCHPSFRGWLEMKRDDKKPTALQKIFMHRLTKAGDVCVVVRYNSHGETTEFETPDGHSLGWLNLRPLYGEKTKYVGNLLLCGLRAAWEIARSRDK